MNPRALFLIIPISLLLTSCPYGEKLDKFNSSLDKAVSDLGKAETDLNARIDDTQKTIANIGQGAVRAVPGERYLQLIDDLFSGDDAKKKKAQDLLRNLAGIDASMPLAATVYFDNLAPGDQLEAACFRASTPTFEEISVRLASGNNIDRQTLNGSATGYQSVAFARQNLQDKIDGIFKDAFGVVGSIPIFGPPNKQFIISFSGPKTVPPVLSDSPYDNSAHVASALNNAAQYVDTARHNMAAALADAIFDPYTPRILRTFSKTIFPVR
jgi:hypothetical protein